MKQILILGAGSAGVMCANRFRREFTKEEVEITVVEKNDKHYYQPAYSLVVWDLEEPENIVRPVKGLLHEGINLIMDEALEINPKENKVKTAKHGELYYDYLIITTGAAYSYEEPEGLKEGLDKGENVFTNNTFDGTIKLRDKIREFDGGTIVCTTAEMPIKCPAAPMKFIFLAEDTMRRRGIRRKCKFIFTTPLPAVFSREPYAGKLSQLFKNREIEAVANYTPAEVDTEKGIIKDYTGKEIKFDLLYITPPHVGQSVIENSEEIGDDAGWVRCNKNTMLHTKFDNIYSIGDATDFPTSKTASGARKQAAILTERMKAHIRGGESKATYDGEIICPILTRYKRVMFANFNYTESLSPAIESYFNWVIKVHMLRPMYWNLMLNGLM
ncbi:MAG: NAD(P)/FAD-dependent oxidoreductase [Nitrospirae bacterium]|nr:MAG: NAD(P)/FAD-dependent oxidoreductase [Nitrospirota bacterium]